MTTTPSGPSLPVLLHTVADLLASGLPCTHLSGYASIGVVAVYVDTAEELERWEAVLDAPAVRQPVGLDGTVDDPFVAYTVRRGGVEVRLHDHVEAAVLVRRRVAS